MNRFQRLAKCISGEEVKVIAVTAKTALLPASRASQDYAQFPVPAAIMRRVRFKVLVSDPDSAEAAFRSGVESGFEVPHSKRLLQRDAREVTTTLLDVYRRQLRVSATSIKSRLDIRRTSVGIGFSLWLFKDIAFAEPHHFGREEGDQHLCKFSTLIIPQGNREYDLLTKHFDALWYASETKKLSLD
jgi:hypothetical protein